MSSSSSSNHDEKDVELTPARKEENVLSKDAFDESDEALPSPAIAATPKPKPKLSAAMIIPVWIVLSSAVIIYNNYLYNTLAFKYPVWLVTWHLTFAVRFSFSFRGLG